MAVRPFTAFSASHGAAVLATLIAAAGMIRLNRSRRVPETWKRRANLALAAGLGISVLMDPVLTWWRYHPDPALAARLLRENALPLHLCDVVALVLMAAIIRKSQRAAELGYLWGLSGTLQGLITPTLEFDWHDPEYYAFFAQHGGVPVAALTLVFGCGLKPGPGALFRTIRWSWLYMAVTSLCNWMLTTNYGFFNGPPPVASLLDFMGPWPWYLITLQGVAVLFFALLLLPFRGSRHCAGPAAG